MTDPRPVLERARSNFPAPELPLEHVLRGRDRRRRNHRVGSAAFALALFAAVVGVVANWPGADRTATVPADGGRDAGGATAPQPDLVGYVGLPPEGAQPSAPESGELVLSFYGRSVADGGQINKIFLYADGRLISWRESQAPEGANPGTYLEQHLTPDGVELLRAEVLSEWPAARDTYLLNEHSEFFFWGEMQVRDGDRLRSVRWTTPYYTEDPPGPGATREQARELERVDALLADPASWLPATAWEYPEVRAFVPSRFQVCSGTWESASIGPADDPSRILSVLPAAASDILRAQDWTRGETAGPDDYCSELSTDQARALDEAIRSGGLEPDPRQEWRLEYRLAEVGVGGLTLWFEAILPHGEALCSPCG